MVIIDEKSMSSPPPPYIAAGFTSPPPFPSHVQRSVPTLAALPPHLLLKIVWMTFPHTAGGGEGRVERQRRTLHWLSFSLRHVNRSFYLTCMHVLRSTYLPSYTSMIRPPYTSDPFPLSTPSPTNPFNNGHEIVQRETQILDLFIALKVREDVMMDESELHLEREDSFKDLFDVMQPRSRLEDLVRYYGTREGVVVAKSVEGSVSLPSAGPSSSTSRSGTRRPTAPKSLPFSQLSISFSPRKVSLVLTSAKTRRTIVEATRTRDEKLEVTAKQLVKHLKIWLNNS